MKQGIKKLQWFEYLIVVFLEILNAELIVGFLQIRSQISAFSVIEEKSPEQYFKPIKLFIIVWLHS